MTIYTPIESLCRVDMRNDDFKNVCSDFKANTESIEHHPKDLKLFLGEHKFFGIKKLKHITLRGGLLE